MHHVCRKLRLRPGERVVEAGFGWGRLARAHGQALWRQGARLQHLQGAGRLRARLRQVRRACESQIEYIEDDYRNISGSFDAFVSVGMLEHVGIENYRQLGKVAHGVLGGNGRGLIHSIGRNYPAQLHPWIEQRIFPGACPPALSEMSQIFEPWEPVGAGRGEPAAALRAHAHRLAGPVRDQRGRVRGMFDERFVRMWRLYLAGSMAAFTPARCSCSRCCSRPRRTMTIAMTRDHVPVLVIRCERRHHHRRGTGGRIGGTTAA